MASDLSYLIRLSLWDGKYSYLLVFCDQAIPPRILCLENSFGEILTRLNKLVGYSNWVLDRTHLFRDWFYGYRDKIVSKYWSTNQDSANWSL